MNFPSLADQIGSDNLLTDPESCWAYGYDNSKRHGQPAAVAFATSHTGTQSIVKFCLEHNLSIVARGRGTGTTGGAVPIEKSLVISFERMNNKPEIDPINRYAYCEPGVTNQELQDAAGQHNFFWPPDPSSGAFCTVGGNLAFNSSGPRAVKYGTPRENTLGLKCVLANGETLDTGSHTTKSVVGYDLTRLIIGSEGTLALITGATLKLHPIQPAKRTFQAFYSSIVDAASAVTSIMSQPNIPCALEFIDHNALNAIRKFSNVALPDQAKAMLMIEIDGHPEGLHAVAPSVIEATKNAGLTSIKEAATAEESATLWATRKALSPALRNLAPKKINEDVVVPVSRLAELITALDQISEKFGIPIVNFGHAGNGNIHTNILYDPANEKQKANAEPCLSAVFDTVIALNGSLSGEHGVGIDKRDHVYREISPVGLQTMRQIKHAMDPKGILNPNKGFPTQ